MVYEFNRIIIRPFELRDAKDLFKITNDPAVSRYVEYAYCHSVEEATANIANYYSKGDFVHDFYYVITHTGFKDRMIGALIVTQNLDHEFEVSSIIGKEYRGKGYLRYALIAFINSMPKGSKLVFYVKRDNYRSIRSLQFLNMNIEPSDDPDAIKYAYTV